MITGLDLRCESRRVTISVVDTSHLGLILDKFATQLVDKFATQLEQKDHRLGPDKAYALRRLCLENSLRRACPVADARLDERSRHFASMLAGRGGMSGVGHLESRLAIGLGQASPLENGVLLHHVYSVPYLPGSGLKGLARAYATHWAQVADDEGIAEHMRRVDRIFGPLRQGDEAGAVGSVIFFDALPISPRCCLEKDVMTPHQPDYYGTDPMKHTPAAPADWNSPTPLAFVTLAAGTKFRVMLAPRKPDEIEANEDIETAWTWLKDGLEILGIGAKTASGYGRIRLEPEMILSSADLSQRQLG